jgi:hypothetical protein
MTGSFASFGTFGTLRTASGAGLTPGVRIVGEGTQEVTFQNPFLSAPNNLRFDGVTQSYAGLTAGRPFLLGYLAYTNGVFVIDEFLSRLSVGTTAGAEAPALLTQQYESDVRLNVTGNCSCTTDFENADILYFPSAQSIGGMRVLENQAGRVEVWGYFGSLNLFSLGQIVSSPGSAFFYGAIDVGPFASLPDGFVPTATGNGTLPVAPPAGAISPSQVVPEPAVVLLTATGLLALTGVAARRRAM